MTHITFGELVRIRDGQRFQRVHAVTQYASRILGEGDTISLGGLLSAGIARGDPSGAPPRWLLGALRPCWARGGRAIAVETACRAAITAMYHHYGRGDRTRARLRAAIVAARQTVDGSGSAADVWAAVEAARADIDRRVSGVIVPAGTVSSTDAVTRAIALAAVAAGATARARWAEVAASVSAERRAELSEALERDTVRAREALGVAVAERARDAATLSALSAALSAAVKGPVANDSAGTAIAAAAEAAAAADAIAGVAAASAAVALRDDCHPTDVDLAVAAEHDAVADAAEVRAASARADVWTCAQADIVDLSGAADRLGEAENLAGYPKKVDEG